MSQRLIFRLLLAFALAFAGSAAQLHSLTHAQCDLAAAAQAPKAPSPLKHATDQCLVVHALDGTAAETGVWRVADLSSEHSVPPVAVRSDDAPAAAYRSRAPPLLA